MNTIKLTAIIISILFGITTAFGAAKVQVIHNSALPGAAEVDVYINGAKPDILDNFAFRTATPFVDLPAGVDIVVTIAGPGSMNVDDQKIASFNLGMLEDNMEYVVVANGIVGDNFMNPDEGNRNITFQLYPMGGQQSAMNMNNVDVNIFHGATDAPAVDIYADLNLPALISNLDYAKSTGYVGVPPAMYNFTLTVAGNKEAQAGTFKADLTGLKGGAAVVFASGFLSTDDEGAEIPADYGFGLYAALPDGTVINLPAVMEDETAKVQVIHNSALPGAAEVDVYINGTKPDILDNFAFRTATPFVELPSGADIVVTVAGPGSMDVEDQVIATFNLGQLEAGMEYVVVANGILGDNFMNPDEGNRDITFQLYPMGGQQSAMNTNNVDVNIFHGATDAPAVDIYADLNMPALISNLDYAKSTGYVGVPPALYNFTLTVAGNKEAQAGTFKADLTGLKGGAAVVFASGFLSTDDEGAEIPADYGFGLYAALPDGTVINLPAVMEDETAKVQVIHNSALPGAAEVDVYINGTKPDILDNFAFRTATPFVELPSGADIVVTVAGPGSMDVEDQVIATFNLGQLEAGMEYVVVANGILGDNFMNPDEGNRDITFQLYPMGGQQSAMNMDMVDFNVFHGVTDAPAVDVYADLNQPALISGLDYAASTGYVSVPPASYNLTVTVAGNKEVQAGTYVANLSALRGGAAVVFASGFLSTDDEGTEIPADYGFGLYAALPDGTVVKFDNLSTVEDIIYNSDDFGIFPNPARESINIEFPGDKIKELKIFNTLGEVISSDVTLSASNVISYDLTSLTNGMYYIMLKSDDKTYMKQLVVAK